MSTEIKFTPDETNGPIKPEPEVPEEETKEAVDGQSEAPAPVEEVQETKAPQPEAEDSKELFSEDELTSWVNHYSENGELSEEIYSTLEERGLPKSVVDSWIEGQQALASQADAQAHALIGGKTNYDKMSEWAVEALSEAERDAFNSAVQTPGPARDNAIKGLWARFENANGPSRRVAGNVSPSAGPAPFRSTQEMVRAMKDPRYGKDPAYTQDVADRVGGMS